VSLAARATSLLIRKGAPAVVGGVSVPAVEVERVERTRDDSLVGEVVLDMILSAGLVRPEVGDAIRPAGFGRDLTVTEVKPVAPDGVAVIYEVKAAG
jgi:hypothetical protein